EVDAQQYTRLSDDRYGSQRHKERQQTFQSTLLLVRDSLLFPVSRFACFKRRAQLFFLSLNGVFALFDKAAEIVSQLAAFFLDSLPAFSDLVRNEVLTVVCGSRKHVASLSA